MNDANFGNVNDVIDLSLKLIDLSLKLIDLSLKLIDLSLKLIDLSLKLIDLSLKLIDLSLKLIDLSLKFGKIVSRVISGTLPLYIFGVSITPAACAMPYDISNMVPLVC